MAYLLATNREIELTLAGLHSLDFCFFFFSLPSLLFFCFQLFCLPQTKTAFDRKPRWT